MLLLTLLCLGVYTLGPTTSGLLNTQETLRLTTAMGMQERADWVVPMRDGRPYLAKPPMIYWTQLAIAEATGTEIGLLHLRLSVALAGWLGVLATYAFGRRVFGGRRGDGGETGWWAALGLSVGILYVRSSRIGELDVFLVPFVVLALLGVHGAWRAHIDRGRTGWAWLALAMGAAAGGALTKGPVPLIVIAVAGYGGIVLHAVARACREDARGRTAGRAGAALGAAGLLAGAGVQAEGLADAPGVLLFGVIGAGVGWLVGRASTGACARRWGPAMWRCHPELVLGAGVAALAAWGVAVRRRVGAEALEATVSDEVGNNLVVLYAASPVRNLEFLAYGLLPMSVAGVVGLLWMVREREPLDAGRAMAVSWLGLGYVAFSVLGKGVARYLTPLWPAVAIVGAIWLVHALRGAGREGGARRMRVALYAAVLVAGGAQAWWYGAGQDRFFGERSPRDFAAEIRDAPWLEPGRLGAFELSTWALEHYLGAEVDQWDGRGPDANVEEMASRVADGGSAYHLFALEETPEVVERHGSIRDRLERAGLDVSPVEVGARWVQSPGRTPVRVLRLERAGGRD